MGHADDEGEVEREKFKGPDRRGEGYPSSRALERTYRLHAGIVRKAALEVLECRDLAEDAVHQVFFRLLLRGLPDNPASYGPAYFRAAGRREALRMLRDSGRRTRLVARHHPLSFLSLEESPLDREERVRRAITLDQAIRTLPPRMREVARMSWVEALSARKIAAILNITEKRVEKTRGAARQSLKKRLVNLVQVSPGCGAVEEALEASATNRGEPRDRKPARSRGGAEGGGGGDLGFSPYTTAE